MFSSLESWNFKWREYKGKGESESFLELDSMNLVSENTDTGEWNLALEELLEKKAIPYNVGRGVKNLYEAQQCTRNMPKDIFSLAFAKAIDSTLAWFRVCNYVHSLTPKEYDPESVIHRAVQTINNDSFIQKQKYLSRYVVKVLRGGVTGAIGTGEGTKHGHKYDVRGHWRQKSNGNITWIKPHSKCEDKPELGQEVQFAKGDTEKQLVEKNSFYEKARILMPSPRLTAPLKALWIRFKRMWEEYVPLTLKK